MIAYLQAICAEWVSALCKRGRCLASLIAIAGLFLPVASVRAEAVYAITNGGIFSVDTLSGGPAVQLTTFNQTQAATLAVRPSDGVLFFLDSTGNNPGLWRWDPATPATPPVYVGTTGASFTGVIRLGFDSTSTLFAMNPGPGSTLWTLDASSGGILSAIPTSGDSIGGGGDLCLQPGTGALYAVSATELYTVTSTGVITLLGTITGAGAANVTGCAFDRAGRLLISPSGSTTIFAVSIGTLAATALPASTGLAVGAVGDLGTVPNRMADLSLTKTANNLAPGNTVSFTITVSNAGPDRATDVRVLDVLPAGLTFVSATASQGTYSTAAVGVIPAGTWRVNTLNNGASATLTINATVTGSTSIVNTAQISHSDQFDPDSTPNNSVAGEDDQASVTITPSPDLRIVKTATSSFVVGVNGTYSLAVDNLLGSAATSGTITVTDVLPAGLTFVSAAGTGWTCAANTPSPGDNVVGGNRMVCTSGTSIAAGATSPNPITLTVLPAAAAAPSVNNTATVSGGGEPASNNGNNSNTITTTVCATNCPDLRPNKTVGASPLTVGTNSTYTLSVTNIGGLSTGANPYTLIDTLPTGLTLATAGGGAGWTIGAGWTCTANTPAAGDNIAGGSRVVCTSATAIAAGATSSAVVIPVVVANTAVPSVTNTLTVSGGGEPASANVNNTLILTTPVTDFDLTITKTKTTAANFALGVTTDTYTVVVNNIGGRATTGTYTVTDILPTGLTLTSAGGGAGWVIGAGWTCAANTPAAGDNVAGGSRVVCTRATAIAAAASSTTIVFPVTVAAAAVPSVTNTATVANPSEAAALTGNNSSAVTTPVNAPDLVISKSHAFNFVIGQNGTYTITVFNQGAQVTNAVTTVTDNLPVGMTFVSATGTNWTCAANTPAAGDNVVGGSRMVCTRTAGNTIAANSAAPPITLVVAVTAAAAPSQTNTATVSGGGEPAGNAGNNSDSDNTLVFASPTLAKGFAPTTIVAGAPSVLTLTINNPATTAATGLALVDSFPAGMSVTATPGFTNTCGGTIGSGNAANDTAIILSGGGPLAAGASCTITVNVTSTTVGANVNTTGAVSSTNNGIGNAASATLTVTAPGSPVLSKLSSPNPVGVNQLSTLTFTITNKATATTDMAFTDTFPVGVVYQSTGAGTCTSTGGTAFALTDNAGAALVAGAAGIRAVGIDLAGGASCTIIVRVRSTTPGTYANVNANITGLAGGLTANVNDTLVVVGTTLTKAFSPSTVAINQASNLTFTITNGAGLPAQGGLAFTETLPAGVTVAAVPAASQCNGTVTAVAGGNTITFAGGAIALGNADCTIVAPVQSGVNGTYNNTPANVTGLSSGMTNNATATLTVTTGVALSVVKTLVLVCDPTNFNVNPRAIPGAYMRYEITISNAAVALNSATLTTIGDVLDLNLNFDNDLRSGSAAACATSPPESAVGSGFKLTCAGGTRACNTPVFFTSAADTDAIGIGGSTITLTFGDTPAGVKALPTETGYSAGQLKPGESVTIRFNAIVR